MTEAFDPLAIETPQERGKRLAREAMAIIVDPALLDELPSDDAREPYKPFATRADDSLICDTSATDSEDKKVIPEDARQNIEAFKARYPKHENRMSSQEAGRLAATQFLNNRL